MHHTRKTRPGFTLVELLVVIGIIAVLIAILLPTISAARRQGNTAACMSNLRSLGQAFAGYVNDFKEYPWSAYYGAGPAGGGSTGDGSESDLDKRTYVWWSVIRGYMRGKGAPFDNSIVDPKGGTTLTRFMEAFNCPTGNDRNAGCDFVSNNAIMPWSPTEIQLTTEAHPINRKIARPHKPNWVYPDNIILFDASELGNVDPPYSRQYVTSFDLDNDMYSSPKKPTWRYRGVGQQAGLNYDAQPLKGDGFAIAPGPNNDSGTAGSQGQVRWRHGKNDSANFLFADGSVKNMSITRGFDKAGTALAPGVTAPTGEVLRKYFRPKPIPGYSMIDL